MTANQPLPDQPEGADQARRRAAAFERLVNDQAAEAYTEMLRDLNANLEAADGLDDEEERVKARLRAFAVMRYRFQLVQRARREMLGITARTAD